MDAPAFLRPLAGALQRFVLPFRCLLCGAAGDEGRDLCRDCAHELPRNRICCARCALPLPEPAAQCGQCQRRAPPWDAAWVPFRYAWPLDRLESRFKFSADLASGRVLSALWLREPPPSALPACIVPVPLHAGRLRERGYNQVAELAKALSRHFGVRWDMSALTRVRATSAQTELGAPGRRRNVRGAFMADSRESWPAHVALLDDVMTTGATLAECTRQLKRAGVQRVDVWALARAPRPGG
ncbi:ComF family protein [Dyella sp. C11]|uniref:ComF family protein n=1 Tax=Dyella sp. C11 TaxID=2126991 RepID=UPI000D64EEF7|nr:ComF family protein [Dyella sp. C11]